MKTSMTQGRRPLPEIVSIVISEVERRRARGEMSETEAEMKLERLVQEELEPRGFTLCRWDAGQGEAEFAVRSARNGECFPINRWTATYGSGPGPN